MSDVHPIIKKRIGFLAATALGISAFLITCVVCCTVMLVYGLHVASDKTDNLVCLVERTVRGLPDVARALPPALGDLVSDRRRPDYAGQIEAKAQLLPPVPGQPIRVAVEVANRGTEMVTLLSLRITATDADGRIVCEANDWAATPFAADGPWRGPLMAGAIRQFNASAWMGDRPAEGLKAAVEITDIRVWKPCPPETPESQTPTHAILGDVQM